MNCPKCGKINPENRKTCLYCDSDMIGATQLHTGGDLSEPAKSSQDKGDKKGQQGIEHEGKAQISGGFQETPGGKTQFVQNDQQEKPGTPSQDIPKQPGTPGNVDDLSVDDELELLRKTLVGRYEITR